MDNQPPPQNVELEQSLLGGILCDPATLDDAKVILLQQDFYLEPHQIIFRSMIELQRRGVGIDAMTLSDALAESQELDKIGGKGYLVGLWTGAASGSGVVHYAQLVREKSRQRAILRAIEEVRGQLYNSATTADGALQTISQRLDLIAGGASDSAVHTVDELGLRLESQLARGTELQTTGAEWLDGLTGGWQPGDLWVWAARTNTGKTRVLLYRLLMSCQAGIRCGVISLDMGPSRLTRYILSSANAIGGFTVPMDLSEMVASGNTNVAPGVSYFCPPTANGMLVVSEPRNDSISLEGYIRTLVRKHGCKVIAIDQAQNFADYNQEERQSIGKVVKSCKEWARHYDVTIVLVHQINRDGYDQPSLKNLKDSSVFAEYSDFVVILHDKAKAILDKCGSVVEVEGKPGHFRPPKPNETGVQLTYVPSRRWIKFDLAKSRHGDTGAQTTEFDFALGVAPK